MKIHVGSQNKLKVQAVRDAVALYPKLFPHPEIIGVDVNVPLFDHPKSLKETIEGARKRVKNAFFDCSYSIGIEGGLMEVPHSISGYMEVSVGAVYDGKEIYLGLSPAFEWPKSVTDLIINDKVNANQAFKQLGLTHHEKLGSEAGGGAGLLTHKRFTREDSIKYSLIMAFIHLENLEIYKTV
jgi:inosine/xanthosine triphosphatase